MIVRALALQHIQAGNYSFLVLRELGVAFLNGIVWGGVMGIVTWLLYDDPALGGVMTLAMVLNLLVAATMGVAIPMIMTRLESESRRGFKRAYHRNYRYRRIFYLPRVSNHIPNLTRNARSAISGAHLQAPETRLHFAR